ncbi:MAG: AMP-binding protein [Pseudomonadota bacterium]
MGSTAALPRMLKNSYVPRCAISDWRVLPSVVKDPARTAARGGSGLANIFDVFAGFKSPHAIAIKTDDGRQLRFEDLDALSARICGVFCDSGVRPGDRVAVQVKKSPEALALYLACLRFGAIFVPMNTAYTADEAAHIVEDSDPALLVVDPGLAAASLQYDRCAFHTLEGRGGSLMQAAADTTPMSPVYDADADDPAAILYTSGTTGQPKGAVLSHRNLSSNAKTLAKAWRFTAEDTLLHALPIFHAHGLFVASNVSFMAGCQQLLLDGFSVEGVLTHLPHATVFMGVPTFYTRLLASPKFTRAVAEHMRLFTSGSAPLLPQTFKAFEDRAGSAILERYGMTETVMISSNLYDGPRIAGAVGPALADITIRIVGPDGAEVPPGETGDVEVKGPNVMTGYWRAPDKTAQSFTNDGYFKTGDQGYKDDAGYVFLVGRAKDMIISGGFNVYPIEIEQALNARPEIDESAVIGIAHADFGEAVTAVIVPRSGYDVDETALLSDLKTSLANYKVPKALIERDTLPRNTMGKVRKEVLRDAYASYYSS